MATSYAKIRPRRGTLHEWTQVNPILMEGELGIEVPDSGIGTGLCKFKLGDGNTRWNDLAYSFDGQPSTFFDGGNAYAYSKLQIRRDTTAHWLAADPVIHDGEPVLDTTLNLMKIGDGVKKFSELEYQGSKMIDGTVYDFGDIDEEN